jgi:hypothetical protein
MCIRDFFSEYTLFLCRYLTNSFCFYLRFLSFLSTFSVELLTYFYDIFLFFERIIVYKVIEFRDNIRVFCAVFVDFALKLIELVKELENLDC